MSLAIETRDLARSFGELLAVDALDLRVPGGCVYGFLGPNGAGKTTTIRLLLGLLVPDRGGCRIDGIDLARERCRALARVGAIVERPGVYPNLTGRENLQLAVRTHGGSRSEIPALARLVDLEGALDRRAGRYSLGMRQRLALARALLGRPRLLILDEPTNGLDPAGIAQFRELIRELPERYSTTVFLSSHLLGEIEQTADHCGLLHRGRLVYQGPLRSLQGQLSHGIELETTRPDAVAGFLMARDWSHERVDDRVLLHESLDAEQRAELLRDLVTAGIPISQLTVQRPGLEQAFFELTGDVP